MNKLKLLIESKKTVFTYDEIKQIFSNLSKDALEKSLFRSKKSGELLNLYKGVWALPVYNEKELACKLKQGSYISLESVLYDAGAIFQTYFQTKTCVARASADLAINDKIYRYTKIKDTILFDNTCIIQYDNYRIATPERALCDFIYLFPKAGIDAPEVFSSPNSLAKFKKLFPLYPKATQEKIKRIIDVSDFTVFKY